MMPATPLPALDAPLLLWACWYAESGWPVFPCQGKRPLTSHGFHDATRNTFQLEFWWSQWPDANIGCPAGPWWYALDEDPRHGGDDTLRGLEKRYGLLPPTTTSLTGGGGRHQLWLPPDAPFTPGKIDLGPGLDVQNDGHYLILPPSIHPDTGRPYVWESDFGPDDLAPQPTPAWLAALLTAPGPWRAPHQTSDTQRDPDAPILEGTRESTLMALAGAMQRQGATYSAIRAALDAENARCVPPLESTDLDRMAHSVQRYAPAPRLHVGSTSQAPGWSQASTGDLIRSNWRGELFSKKNGELFQNVTNIKLILEYHRHWQTAENALWWDSVKGTPMCGSAEIDQTLMLDICDWLGRAERLPITRPRLVEECVITQCKKHPRDLLQHALGALSPWDQTPRLGTWLRDIAGAADGPYTAAVSQVLLVSMIARAMQPGCHYRFVVILEGAEDIGKTLLVRELGTQEWYVDLAMNLESKESHMMLQGVWVAELSELDSLTRTAETRLKAFITLHEDSYIPKFSNFREKVKRRAIFVGTTNEECYLKGQSGNTRYLPIRLHHAIDIGAFLAIRPQLLAEAKHYYVQHPLDWWSLPSVVLEQARDEREKRRMGNPYEHALHTWLEYDRYRLDEYTKDGLVVFTPGETSWPEIARWFLRLETPEKWKDRSLQMQIGAALRAIGWHVKQVWQHGRNTNRWLKDASDAS